LYSWSYEKLLGCYKNGKVNPKDINFCHILVIDEAHNGSVDNDIIMELWNLASYQCSAMNSYVPRLLLASATLDIKNTIFPDAPTEVIETKGFPIDLKYSTNTFDDSDEDLYKAMADLIFKYHNTQPIPTDKGTTWLAFCPGAQEVEDLKKYILKFNPKDMEIVPFYSEINDDSSVIFTKPKAGIRRIIISTNIAETSITIEDLSGIFDSMFEKYSSVSQSGAYCLVTDNITKASAQQRKGRTGRTCPGFCYRMCTEEFYNKLGEQRVKEIQRIPLHNVVIKLLDAGLEPENMFQKQLPQSRLFDAVSLLKYLGMVNHNSPTEKGRFASIMPLSVRCSSILWEWKNTTEFPLFPCICAISLIDLYGPAYYYYPRFNSESKAENDKEREKYYQEHFKIFEGTCELESLLNMWNDMWKEITTGGKNSVISSISTWSSDNSINRKRILDCYRNVIQIRKSLNSMKIPVKPGAFTPQSCLYVLTPILEEAFRTEIYHKAGKGFAKTNSRDLYRADTRIFNVGREVNFTTITALATNEIETRDRKIRVISLFHPIGLKFTPPVSRSPNPIKVIKNVDTETYGSPQSVNPRMRKIAKYAYVTLVMESDRYVPGALVLAQSLRNTCQYTVTGLADLVCMVTSDVSREAIDKLSIIFDYIKVVNVIEKQCRTLQTKHQKDLYASWINKSFTKWNCLSFNYDKVLFMDADTIAVKSIDNLFELPSPAGVFSLPWSSNYTGTISYTTGEPVGLKDVYAPLGIVNTGDKVPRDLIKQALGEELAFVCWGTSILLPCSPNGTKNFISYLNSFEVYGFPDHSGFDEQSIVDFFNSDSTFTILQTDEKSVWTNIDRSYNMVPYQGKEGYQMPNKENSVLHYTGKEKPWEIKEKWDDLKYWNTISESFQQQYKTTIFPDEKKEIKKKKKKFQSNKDDIFFDQSGNLIGSKSNVNDLIIDGSGRMVETGQIFIPKLKTKYTMSTPIINNDTMSSVVPNIVVAPPRKSKYVLAPVEVKVDILQPITVSVSSPRRMAHPIVSSVPEVKQVEINGRMEINLYKARTLIDKLVTKNAYEYGNIVDRMMINYVNKNQNGFAKAKSECEENGIDPGVIDKAKEILELTSTEYPTLLNLPDETTQKLYMFLVALYPTVDPRELVKCCLRYGAIGMRGQQWRSSDAKINQIKTWGFNTEAFASPFNRSFERYYSAFDEDAPFGSLGSFFGKDHSQEYIYANPPFTPYILDKMADEICNIKYAIIVTPTWTDADWYKKLESCGFKPQIESGLEYVILDSKFNPKFTTSTWFHYD